MGVTNLQDGFEAERQISSTAMTRLNFLFISLAAVCLSIIEKPSHSAERSTEYQIYVATPPISNHAIQEHRDLPPTCQPGTAISLMACRGEYEPASFVIEAESKLENVLVTAGDLTGVAGTIPSNAVDIRVVQPCWLRVSDLPGRMNWVLLHDPSLLKIVYEADKTPYSAGMSFTRKPVDTETLQAANVAARQQFWLTVHVPAAAPTGTYSGTVSITSNNAATRELTLELTVPGFELREPNFQYSVFYACEYHNDQSRFNEYANMAAHGCMNPSFYRSVALAPDGMTLDFTPFANELDLREKAGMAASGPLYLVSSGPINAGTSGLSSDELAQLSSRVEETVAWIRKRGYSDVYFMGGDEAVGQKIVDQRPTWEGIRKAGGKVFISNFGGFYPFAGDITDLAVITHPSGNPIDVANTSSSSPDEFVADVATLPGVTNCVDWILDPATHDRFNPPDYPTLIQNIHKNGYKIFTYMDSLAGGYGIPEVQRRLRGYGLWKASLDGTMPWSYHHFRVPPHSEAGPLHWSNFHSFVLLGAESPFDTPSWEGYREGYDDARYLATLQHAIDQCKESGERQELVTETESWLDAVPTDVELNGWRRQMAIRTEKLLGLKATVSSRGFDNEDE